MNRCVDSSIKAFAGKGGNSVPRTVLKASISKMFDPDDLITAALRTFPALLSSTANLTTPSGCDIFASLELG